MVVFAITIKDPSMEYQFNISSFSVIGRGGQIHGMNSSLLLLLLFDIMWHSMTLWLKHLLHITFLGNRYFYMKESVHLKRWL